MWIKNRRKAGTLLGFLYYRVMKERPEACKTGVRSWQPSIEFENENEGLKFNFDISYLKIKYLH